MCVLCVCVYMMPSSRHSVPQEELLDVITAPTLVIWGEKDAALGSGGLLRGLDRFAPHAKVVKFAAATHWVHHDEPRAVNDELRRFLAVEESDVLTGSGSAVPHDLDSSVDSCSTGSTTAAAVPRRRPVTAAW